MSEKPEGQQREAATQGEGVQQREGAKIVEHYPQPEPEPPPPTFRQALIGYGSIFLALVALGVLLGLLMRFLR